MKPPSPVSLSRFDRWTVLLALGCGLLAITSMDAAERRELGANSRNQIEALLAEKAARSPAQRKLDSQLIYALRQRRQQRVAPGLDQFESAIRPRPDGRVLVDLRARVEPEILARIEAGGGTVVSRHPRFQAIRAWVPLELVEVLAERPEVRNVRPADEAMTNVGPITSEGDVTHQAASARSALVVDGNGVKVGVLSDSVDYLADSQSGGELPIVTVLPGQAGYGSGEGTAMLEIVHDLAPGAQLYFASAFQGVAAFAQSILDLHAAGCRVIVDDVTYFAESPFQDGPIAQAVNEVSAAGTLYFSSAGNSGNLSDGTSGTWEGDFRDGGPATLGRGGRLHDFGGSTLNTVWPGGSIQRVDLFWSDPLGQSTNDYDVYVLNSDGSVASSSSNVQNGDDDPYEAIPFVPAGKSIVIVKYSGADRFLYLSSGRARLDFNTSGATRGHNASGASNAFCVAATWVRSPAVPFTGGVTNPVETFSSDGPRHMFFQPDGTPITPGDFSATGGLLLQKPDLTAADGVATSVPGFKPFFGTSAAAPHAAAIAALLWSYNPGLTPAEVRLAMESTALDIESLFADRDSGAGIVMALASLLAPPTPLPRLVFDSSSLSGGNGNATLDADECGDVVVTLRNLISPSGQTATGVVAELRSTTPGVVADPSPRAFPDIPAAGFATNALPFYISTTPGYSCAAPATFSLRVTTDNAGEFNLSFQLASTPPTTGSALTYLATDVPVLVSDLGIAESSILVSNLPLQIARVRLALHATHSYDSDLVISLIGPDGTAVELTSNNGGSGTNYGTGCMGLTLFDDEAAVSITAGVPPFAGTFRPEQPLAAFIGKSPQVANGEWKLRFQDTAEQDSGAIQCWTLEISPIACATGGGACLVPPSITVQPQDVFATNGNTVQFAVVVEGSAPLLYQWFFNTTNLLAEATNALLTLPSVVPDQAGAYSVLVSNLYGIAVSTPAQLTVVVPPQIVQPPQDTLTTNGMNVQLAVVAAGSPPLTYQWFFNGTNLLSDATNPVLMLTSVTPSQTGRYSVLVSNPYGSVLSSEAVFEVAVLPFITQQPQNQTVNEGGTANFMVGAGGTEPLSYHWYFNETNRLAAVGPSLVLSGVTSNDAGGYSVIVSNAYGTVTSTEAELAVSVVNDPPVVTLTSPTNGSVFALDSGSVLLEATATDFDGSVDEVEFSADGMSLIKVVNAPYRFEWVDVPVGSSAIVATATDNEGARATSAVAAITVSLTTNFTRLIPTGSIWKYFDQGVDLGSAWRALDFDDSAWPNGPAQLGYGDNDEATVVSFGPSSTNKYTTTYFRRAFVLTDPAAFTNLAVRLLRDDGAVAYLNGVEVFRSNLPTGEVTFSTLALVAVSGSQERAFFTNFIDPGLLVNGTNVFAVEVHQSGPTSTDLSFELELLGQRTFAPRLLVQPESQTVFESATVVFSASAAGGKPLGYQWTFNGTNVLPSATNATLMLNDVTSEDSGVYVLTVSNAFGQVASSNAWLNVIAFNDPPTVTLDSPTNGATFDLHTGPIFLQATASDPDGTIARVQFFAEGPLLGEDFTAPYQFEWLDAGVGIHDLTAVAIDSEGGAATSAVVRITVNFSTNLAHLVSTGAEWKYLDTGVDQGTNWRSFTFDDSTWASGPAQLGYGDGDEATVVGYGPSETNRYPTTYFRRSFVLTDAPAFTNAVIRLLRDDGAVVYLNQVEIFRSNMPTGQIGFATFAASTVSGAAESNLFFTALIDSTLLRNGTNLLAVEVHQINASSTDVSFDLSLEAERLLAPLILVQPASVAVSRGATATLSVAAFGTAPLNYQWVFNQTNTLAGATNSDLVIDHVISEQAGGYSVTVSNPLGSVTSEEAVLTVLDTNAPPVVALSNPPNGAVFFADAASIVLEAAASDPDGSIAQVAFFANNTPLGIATAPPFRADWLDASLGNHDLSAIATDQLGASSTSAVVKITVRLATNTARLVSTGAVWKYLDTGVDQGAAWRDLVFDDSVWANGPAQLGYGDGDEATIVSFGTNANSKYITTYFRRAFVLTEPSSFTHLAVRLLRDDGAVVYLNAGEIFRSNLRTGSIAFSTLALAAVSGTDESRFFTNAVVPSLLRSGTNVLAVEIHQNVATSSDLGFDLELQGQRAFPPVILAQPLDVAAREGGTAVFSVWAQGTEPLSYQWFFNDTNFLAGANASNLVLNPVTLAHEGYYSVSVSNAFGKIRSAGALLSIVETNSRPTVAITAPTDGAVFLLNTAPIVIEAAPSDPDGPVAAVSFFANSLPLGTVTASPYRVEWLDAPLGTHSLQAIAIDAQGARATSEVVRITVNFSANVAHLVSSRAEWKYLDTGVDQGTNWRTFAFDDSTWASGPAQLGYGDGDEVTVVSFGTNASSKYPTTYFRRSFVLTDAPAFTNAVIRLLRDDGAVVYLNEVEVFRSNMPTGQIRFATFAASAVSGAAESNLFFTALIDSTLLHNGTNLLAVEVHQINASSTDLSFDLSLEAETLLAPLILVQPASLSVSRGATATFSVSAFGTAPLSYQWVLNQTNTLAGATNSDLVLDHVTSEQAGSYSVTIGNPLGQITSDIAVLTVLDTNAPPQVALTSPVDGAVIAADAAPLVLEASASDPDSTIAQVAFFADGHPLGIATAPPYQADWLDAPFGTHSLLAVATDELGASATSAVVQITVTFATNIVRLVSTGAVWKYLDMGIDQGTAWRELVFDDSTWAKGPAQLGYGDGDEATLVSFGPDANNKYPTTYFRRAFVLTDAVSLTNAAVRLLRDDGAVVYLNGVEVFRSNMPTGSIAFSTLAAGTVSDADETNFFTSSVDAGLLRNGTNVLAVEVHQINATSSDLSLDLELRAERGLAPVIVTQPASVTVSNGGTATFNVVAQGTVPLIYQWYRDQTNLLSNATNPVLILQPATVSLAGTYSVEVSNSYGSTRSAEAVLTVTEGANLPPLVELLTPSNGARFDAGSPISLTAMAADLDGSIASVSFYADGTLLAEDPESPYEFTWLDVPIGLHAVWAVAVDQVGAATVSDFASVSVNTPAGRVDTLVSTGAVWKYLDDGSNQGTAWRAPAFNDSAWASGPAELGYGDDTEGRPEATVISYGTNSQRKHITYYFRHAFVALSSSLLQPLRLELLRDDGAVVYLNGTEVFRSNLPEGDIGFRTTAVSAVSLAEETQFFATNLSSSLLVEGTNVLAVEVHQVNRISSDLSFDLALRSVGADPPRIATHPQSQTVSNGTSVEFNVVASGLEPLRYQWFFNTTNPLPDATNATLLLSNVTPDQAGIYVVEVSDALGTTYSDLAALVVVTPPPNVPPTVVLTSPAAGSTFFQQSAIPLSATAEDTDGSVTKVAFFAGNSLLGEALTAPYAFDWIGASLGDHELRAVATDDRGATNGSASVIITVIEGKPTPPSQVTLISTGAVWKYLDTGIDQGAAWIGAAFDDSTWASGPAELGYGDDTEGRPEATVLGFGPVSTNKYPTYYFRRTFTLTNTTAITELKLRVLRDDGVVVYLNGTEVFRDNLPEGPIAFTNLALIAIGKDDESAFLEAMMPPGLLLEGTNIVAAEIHQVSVSSTDISFDLELVATRPNAPVILLQPEDQTVARGQTAQFVVAATGTEPLAYQWFQNALIAIPNATNDTLLITNAQYADEGSYSVVVTNVAGSTRSDSAILRVLDAPAIVTQPQNVTVPAGDTAMFSVTAAGAEPLTYQWYFNTNTLLPGTDSTTLILTNVGPADTGTYSVTVSNPAGSVSSQPAALRVLVTCEIVRVSRTNGVITLTFTTSPGLRYTVEYNGDLNGSIWTLLPGAVKLTGTGNPLTAQDPGPIAPMRFYRVRVE